jgi:glyoxylase-like metal-dependent hydrolase (beta-lactamase superfamily II)
MTSVAADIKDDVLSARDLRSATSRTILMSHPHASPVQPQVRGFFDPATWTVTYVVYAAPGTPCAIIDSVLDYDPKSGRTSTASADRVIEFVREHGLQVAWILETHAHADHLSAAPYLKAQLGGQTAMSARIAAVQKVFKGIFNLENGFAVDGRQFDQLLADGETLAVGDLRLQALSVPGHTPACMAYQVGDAVFVGDTLFMPDVGSARCDFPGGDAQNLYASVQKILSLPAPTRLFMCHDYPPEGRGVQFETTVAEQRAGNIHLQDGITEADFVRMRSARDATLAMPVLILPAVQINIRAGELPPAEANGVAYLKIPLNAL